MQEVEVIKMEKMYQKTESENRYLTEENMPYFLGKQFQLFHLFLLNDLDFYLEYARAEKYHSSKLEKLQVERRKKIMDMQYTREFYADSMNRVYEYASDSSKGIEPYDHLTALFHLYTNTMTMEEAIVKIEEIKSKMDIRGKIVKEKLKPLIEKEKENTKQKNMIEKITKSKKRNIQK